MPITFQVAQHPATKVNLEAEALKQGSQSKHGQPKKKEAAPMKLITSSAQSENPNRVSCSHGFVRAATAAYNQHYNLIIRPDDVWLAILNQFSTYVNNNAEALRSKFVDFEDKKELTVYGGGSLFTAAYDTLALSMSTEIAKNIRDPSIREWVLPSFTTTTSSDMVVGSVALMAAMQQYFSYKFSLLCGLPSVTLLGEVADWQDIERRAARLAEFDINGQMTKWSKMLAPVLAQFTKSAEGAPDIDFWQKICHYSGGGSGPTMLSGWITLFCVYDDSGKWKGDSKTFQNWGKLEQTEYLFIDTNDLPSGVLQVPVTVDDNGTFYKTTMMAGHSALTIVEETGVQPTLEWSLYLNNEQ